MQGQSGDESPHSKGKKKRAGFAGTGKARSKAKSNSAKGKSTKSKGL